MPKPLPEIALTEEEIDQILRSHYLSKFGNVNRPRNFKSLLHEGRCDGNYSLESTGPPF